MPDNNLNTLVSKRGRCKASLTRFERFLNEINTRENISPCLESEIKNRLDKIKASYAEFIEISEQIDTLGGQGSEAELDAFETKYYTTITLAADVFAKIGDANAIDSDSSVHEPRFNGASGVVLPKIAIPTFSGKFENWLEYKDLFESLIHNNASLNEIQKLHYLKGSLSGEAADYLTGISMTAENYHEAWKIICNRFSNNELLTHHHIDKLLNMPVQSRESADGLLLLDTCLTKHMNALKALGHPTTAWDVIIVHIVVAKLAPRTLSVWERVKIQDSEQENTNLLKRLSDFLREHAHTLRQIEGKQRARTMKEKTVSNVQAVQTQRSPKCGFCKRDHYINLCNAFSKLTLESKRKWVRDSKVCCKCLKYGHSVETCRAKGCQICHKAHHTALHTSNEVKKDSLVEAPQTPEENSSAANTVQTNYSVLLPTAMVHIQGSNGKEIEVRALLDSGAQSNFVSTALVKKLKLETTSVTIELTGIGNKHARIQEACCIHIRKNDFSHKLRCLVIPSITSEIPQFSFSSKLDIPKGVELANPNYNKSGSVDLLIGCQLFFEWLLPEQISLGKNKPILQNTKLGFIVSGIIPLLPSTTTCHFAQNSNLESQLQRFWEVEDYSNQKVKSINDDACEKLFKSSLTRLPSGRFQVGIPLKSSPSELGTSLVQAEKRFYNLERKLLSNSALKSAYVQFMNEYIKMGHMSQITNPSETVPHFYLPHHAVVKGDSKTTKLRVVFDGSAKTTTGVSLNDIQRVGPLLQDDLISIILRARLKRYVVGADIVKMYRQVSVREQDRDLQRILWRSNPGEDLHHYTLNTVTYGTASASYLAIRALHQVANELSSTETDLKRIITRDFYVDDVLTGSNDENELGKTIIKLQKVLLSACFPLNKWISNSKNILNQLQPNYNETSVVHDFGTDEPSKTLGLIWYPGSDKLTFRVDQRLPALITKRTVLSTISQIFDPLGLISPCIINGKKIMKQLWQEGRPWDDELSDELKDVVKAYLKDLGNLANVQVPRHVIGIAEHYELNGFCDASEAAFGACIYATTISNGIRSSELLISKSRIAPVKSVTIPRLELCAALLLGRLVEKVLQVINIDISVINLWSDSSVVLNWIKTDASCLKTFVAHRINEIQNFKYHATWRHVPTECNPADIISRGILAVDLAKCSLWWQGPQWLAHDNDQWPQQLIPIETCNLPEMKLKRTQIFTVANVTPILTVEDYSSLPKLIRIVAFVFRFIKNSRCSNSQDTSHGPLSSQECRNALHVLIRFEQQKYFSTDINILKNKGTLPIKSKLLPLSPFLDNQNTLRVGGRLRHALIGSDVKHPALLHPQSHLAKLIMRHEHIKNLHVGAQGLLYSTRQFVWIINGKNLAKKIVHNCVTCFKAKPRNNDPIMGDLPIPRISQSFPFQHCGVDYAGPITLKTSNTRGAKTYKAYICLFVCLCTKAYHLELVTSLTAEGFIATLRRFASRRGKPGHLYSDNATNFVGANRALKELYTFLKENRAGLSRILAEDSIQWHFIPPRSPNFGGIWESGIKSVKRHLVKVTSNKLFTYEDFITILYQIEGILNSRPLTALSSDPNDITPLSPSHFLIGRAITSVPQENTIAIPENRLGHFQALQKITQQFWKQWKREYLTGLHHRTKWNRTPDNEVNLNDLVLLVDDTLTPMNWQMGRVTKIHPGRDGRVRVVTIKTPNNEFERSVHKVRKLPCS